MNCLGVLVSHRALAGPRRGIVLAALGLSALGLALAGCAATSPGPASGPADAGSTARAAAARAPAAPPATHAATHAAPAGAGTDPVVVAAASPGAPAAAQRATQGAPVVAPAFGIEFLDTRLSAAGSLVDLRYRVLDPDKAAPLLDRRIRPVLVHVQTGKRYYVPQPPIVGALRQTTRGSQAPQPGRTYFMLFANPDRALKGGDTLALFVGEQRVGEFRILQ